MNMIDSSNYFQYDDSNVLPMLREIADKVTYSIITSTMSSPKTASEICCEYRLPLSPHIRKFKNYINLG